MDLKRLKLVKEIKNEIEKFQAKAAAAYGDMVSAERHSKSAKKMIKISVIAGIITTLMLIGLVVLYIAIISHMASKNMRNHYD